MAFLKWGQQTLRGLWASPLELISCPHWCQSEVLKSLSEHLVAIQRGHWNSESPLVTWLSSGSHTDKNFLVFEWCFLFWSAIISENLFLGQCGDFFRLLTDFKNDLEQSLKGLVKFGRVVLWCGKCWVLLLLRITSLPRTWASVRPGLGGNVKHKPDFYLLGIHFSILEVIKSLWSARNSPCAQHSWSRRVCEGKTSSQISRNSVGAYVGVTKWELLLTVQVLRCQSMP